MSDCRVYWGSHGCLLERGHDGGHICPCCDCPPGHHDGVTAPRLVDDEDVLCVARAPYYGPDTRFYGEDAPAVRTESEGFGSYSFRDHQHCPT